MFDTKTGILYNKREVVLINMNISRKIPAKKIFQKFFGGRKMKGVEKVLVAISVCTLVFTMVTSLGQLKVWSENYGTDYAISMVSSRRDRRELKKKK